MRAQEKVQTKVGGLRAIELYYRGIREFESGDTAFFQSKTRLNTPDLGTLMPETFRKVAEFSNQCLSLFDLEFTQAMQAIKSLLDKEFYFKWLSVYMPLKYLMEKGAQQKLMERLDELEVDTNRICFELSPDILIHGEREHSINIEQLRNRGFHFMITDFGGINSPLMRLAYFPVDYVMLSSELLAYLQQESRAYSAIEAIVEFSDSMGAEVIADGVSKAEQAEMLYEAQVKYGAGNLAGTYIAERYIRKKGAKDEEKNDQDKKPDNKTQVKEETKEAANEAVNETANEAVNTATEESAEESVSEETTSEETTESVEESTE